MSEDKNITSELIIVVIVAIIVIAAASLFVGCKNEATNPIITKMYLNDNFLRVSEEDNTATTGINIEILNPSDLPLFCTVFPNYGTVDREIQPVKGYIVTCRLIIRYELLFSMNPGDVLPGTVSAELKGEDGIIYDSVSVNFNIYIISTKDAVTGETENSYKIILESDSEMEQ